MNTRAGQHNTRIAWRVNWNRKQKRPGSWQRNARNSSRKHTSRTCEHADHHHVHCLDIFRNCFCFVMMLPAEGRSECRAQSKRQVFEPVHEFSSTEPMAGDCWHTNTLFRWRHEPHRQIVLQFSVGVSTYMKIMRQFSIAVVVVNVRFADVSIGNEIKLSMRTYVTFRCACIDYIMESAHDDACLMASIFWSNILIRLYADVYILRKPCLKQPHW